MWCTESFRHQWWAKVNWKDFNDYFKRLNLAWQFCLHTSSLYSYVEHGNMWNQILHKLVWQHAQGEVGSLVTITEHVLKISHAKNLENRLLRFRPWMWCLLLYPRDAWLARVLAMTLCLCMCLSQVGVLSKRLDGSSWFWRGGFFWLILHCV